MLLTYEPSGCHQTAFKMCVKSQTIIYKATQCHRRYKTISMLHVNIRTGSELDKMEKFTVSAFIASQYIKWHRHNRKRAKL